MFLALVLANLLVAGWQLWIVPDEVPASESDATGRDAPLALAAVPPAAGRRSQTGQPAAAPMPVKPQRDGQCFRIGPLTDAGMADSLRKRLQRDGIDVAQNAEEGPIWVGHWVQIQGLGTRQQADATVGRLAAGGLDAYVLDAAGALSVSLGVFRDRQRAAKTAAAAERLGFRPVVADRFRTGVQYWLLARVPSDRPAALPDMARESGQILRSEPVPCAQPDIGGATAIH